MINIAEEDKIEGDLNEDEINYLKNTGKFFIMDSLRQLETIFGDLHHNFAEQKLKKQDKNKKFFGFKRKNNRSDSSDESD